MLLEVRRLLAAVAHVRRCMLDSAVRFFVSSMPPQVLEWGMLGRTGRGRGGVGGSRKRYSSLSLIEKSINSFHAANAKQRDWNSNPQPVRFKATLI